MVFAEVWGAAQTLAERIDGPRQPAPRQPGAGRATRPLLDLWLTNTSGASGWHFRRRLAWLGLDETAAATLLSGEPHCASDGTAEARLLAEALTVPTATAERIRILACAEADRRTGVPAVLSASARSGLEALLARRLANIAATPGLLVGSPALARLLAVVATQWIDVVAELVGRLSADRAILARVAGRSALAWPVKGIDATLADHHDAGRTVLALTFSDGARVVYKPRAVGVQVDAARLLRWLTRRCGLLGGVRVPRTLSRNGYGWVRYVPHRDCRDLGAVASYYRRLGALLCLVHVLGGSDFHADNIVASGGFPFLLDAETIMQPSLEWEDYDDDLRDVDVRVRSGVLKSDMLPAWEPRDDGPVAVGALAPGGLSVPTIAGRPVHADAFVDEIVGGFRETYDDLRRCCDALVAPDGPLARWDRTAIRVVVRSTATYEATLAAVGHPRHRRCGLERSLALESLLRPFLAMVGDDVVDLPAQVRLAECESEALSRYDIPLFTAEAAGRGVNTGTGECLAGIVARPAVERARARLASLSVADSVEQQRLIRSAFRVYTAEPATPAAPALPSDPVPAALCYADALATTAVWDDAGAVTWPAPNRWRLESLTPGYYEGAAGVAVFLAAVARLAGPAQRFGDLARAALEPGRRRVVQRGAGAWARVCGFDGVTGFPSVLAGWARTGVLLDDADLVRDAAAACRALRSEQLLTRPADLVGGASGAILDLLAVYAASRDPAVRETALTLAFGLAAWWRSHGHRRPIRDGVAHGTAGLAFACALAYRSGGPALLRDVAGEAWTRALTARPKLSAARRGWCSGLAGVLACGPAVYHVTGLRAVGDDVNRSLDLLLAGGSAAGPSLCCGTAGVVDALLVAADELDRPTLLTAAQDIASGLTAPVGPALPGLFPGIGGVGHVLVQLAVRSRGESPPPPVLSWR